MWARVSYVLLSVWVTGQLWAGPSTRLLAGNRGDHAFFLFVMAHGERVVFHGAAPLHSDRLNVPAGVNMMANTSMLAVSLPLAPVTHLFGPGVSVAVVVTGGLAGTAAAWHWLLRRRLGASPWAAWAGGLWGGFAPGWLAHAGGQINFTCGFVLPFLVDQALRLREPGRVRRGGIILGLLIVVQVFLHEELLLMTAIALALFVAAYAVQRPRTAREAAPRMAAGLGVAAGLSGLLLSYPLYYQFAGPGHYRGQPFVLDQFATSLGSLVTLPRGAVFGSAADAARVSLAPSEEAAFWGPAATVMIILAAGVLWRSAAARAGAFAGLVLLVMSFGSHFRPGGAPGGPPSPLAWTLHVPILDLVTTPRYALGATAIAGLLLALAAGRAPRALAVAGLAVALVPLFPRPLPTWPAPPVPAFFAQRMWRPYLHGDARSVVIVPLPDRTTGREAMRLGAMSTSAYPMPNGYFMGPKDPPADITAAWTSPPRFTTTLLDQVRATGTVPELTLAQRADVLEDLGHWKAAIVVLLPGSTHPAALTKLLSAVLGPPATVGGVPVWNTLRADTCPIGCPRVS
ncbi:hypothetical protein [Actinoplanes sp. L3-i22]|uniref:hypothetical protein n=1 Tax=Actinoplanes sp. L3-i22 TaxID=2836373 RepID=UPI001C74C344|nr:hypothetical protein [Actinoplanes sp. L3-i22]BCY11473.1 hypothetical protein L3i22_065610 [Actinoplanes sp. L3-i22]